MRNATIIEKSAQIRRKNVFNNQRPILWLLPLLFFLCAFFLVPILDVLKMSFTDASMTSSDYHFTFNSYLRVIQDSAFLGVLGVTFFFVAFSVIFQFLLGFLIAFSVDNGERRHLHGTVITRTISLISWAIPGVAIGIIWKIMYAETGSGILNYLLSLIGLDAVAFLTDPKIALLSISIANVWRGTAQSMILLYAGIKTVPMDILEAADVDGASGFRKIVSVVIPSMRSVIMINLLLNIINTFNTFDMIMPLTGGGPGRSTEVLVLSAYRTIFQQLDLGKGCAVAVILLLINVCFGILYIKMNREE
ncbi:carbohydrate ABC transporter permease [Yeguia hominis]|uniref:Sugar ABC transporter permease n=1 Tax=Yeguia hominis TaxID=2763662 RepID=A0A926D8E4_9FIRM|nr:sugar ABC transporter permease [Yeguia hominis]MBC8533272.1 sugar ABC transporter permease [Yeguia hominis]